MPGPLPLTVGLPSFGDLFPAARLGEVVDLAEAVEQAGLDGVVVPEHVVMGPNTADYPWGDFPVPPAAPWLDALTVLTAMAARTGRIRLQTGIMIPAARPAPALAKQAATIDLLSDGRLDLGVGTGWQREELEACGVPFAERGQRLTDSLGACRALWAGGPSSFSSPTVSFDELWCHPLPATPGGPALLVAGSLTARTIDRVVRLGDGWIPIMGTTVDGLSDDVARLRDAWTEAGRDPGDLRVRGSLRPVRDDAGRPDLDATLAGAAELADAGATEVTLSLRTFVDDPDEATGWLAQLGQRWPSHRPA